MTTISLLPAPHPEPTATPATRILLKPRCADRGMVDGAWWPRSRDLASELPSLVAGLDECWGRITRVAVNVRMWPEIPEKVPAGIHTVSVGWFDAEQEPDDLLLLSYTVGRWDLLVVPPECDPERAARLMSAAADVHNRQSTGELMADIGSARHPTAHAAPWDAI
ncbi:DUF5994 family protein [Streptomyces sp. H39-S7]|uniref:DUF5994 family protein n=1 Tax=Streptomyces sp. H39-S7 TaxID=3004357 RepID=UPI0022B0626F|nr:DUF5994 family protein [Streptomyces sp. H39-S7]MCZ4125903.1 DUF5994 family protein [Streptomyces sp. H39-S7]